MIFFQYSLKSNLFCVKITGFIVRICFMKNIFVRIICISGEKEMIIENFCILAAEITATSQIQEADEGMYFI